MKNNLSLPLVTVAMVTYNQENLVKIAIESVLCQSYTNLELIIGDDCSKDNTWEIVNSYKDPRIKKFQNEKNLTQYPNRDKIIDMAKGKYLIFIDGDDIIYPHGLDYMVRMLEAFPECGMALMFWYRNNIVLPAIITPYQFFMADFFNVGFSGTALSNVLFNVDILKEVGGFPPKYISSDNLLRYMIALKYPILLISDNLTWWRETPNQQSNKVSNTVFGFIEDTQHKFMILEHPECPFNTKEKEDALYKINHSIIRLIVKSIIKLNLNNCKRLFNLMQFKLSYIIPPNKAIIHKDPFPGFTSLNPLMLDFDKNPFSQKHE